MQGTVPVELKSFEILEARINKAVELVKRLRADNDALRSENKSLGDDARALRDRVASLESTAADAAVRGKELDAARLTSQQLERELAELREEKRTVVTRVDAMLADLERLSLD